MTYLLKSVQRTYEPLNKDFSENFYILSSKHIFWNILTRLEYDPKNPLKHFCRKEENISSLLPKIYVYYIKILD